MAGTDLNIFLHHLRSVLQRQEVANTPDTDLLRRYVGQGDEAAFEALVQRYGPMVLGVCRRILSNPHDAEDAFQATFLVLVTKAVNLRLHSTLGNWLYGVACRTAQHARHAAFKRRAKEAAMPTRSEKPEDAWTELLPLLDRELERLPEKYRAAIVLCELQGKPRREAAQLLGCAEGTVASRLSRGLALLAKRLAGHGPAVTSAALAGVLAERATAAVPVAMVSSTIRAATLFAAGRAAAAGTISVKVAALTEGVLRTMLLSKLKVATVVLLALAAIGVSSGGVFYQVWAAENPRTASSGERATQAKPDKNQEPKSASSLIYKVEKARDQVAEAEARLKVAQDLLKRLEAELSVAEAETRLKEAQDSLRDLEAELSSAKAKQKRPAAQLIRPQLRYISRTIGQPSFVEAYERTSIYPKVTGYIEKWNVDIGDKVKKGDVLATISAPELREDWESKKAKVKLAQQRVELARKATEITQADVKAAEAHLAEAMQTLSKYQANADRWDTEVKRLRREVEKGVVDPQILKESENQLTASIASRDSAKATVLKAEAKLDSKRAAKEQGELVVKVGEEELTGAEREAKRLAIQIGGLTLTAPFDGTIVARNANTFDFVSPGKGPPIYVIDRVDVVRVFIDVPERDANFIKVGTKATVLIPAFREQPIQATVKRTSWALNVKSRNLRAEIHLPNPKGEILPGMYAYAKVFLERPCVWALPLSALEQIGDKTFYWGYANGRVVRTEVQTSVSDDNWIEVVKRRSPDPGDDDRWELIDGSEQVILGDPLSHTKP
jgi:RNA polymerase sigma factor (sigma-70 family)